MSVPSSPVAASAAFCVCLLFAYLTHGGQDPVFSEGDAYERFMGRWSRVLAPLLVDFARRDGDVVLDVGAGTGALTAALARSAPSSRIIGIDPSRQYVELAQERHGSARIHFEAGDAQRMQFESASFDRTVSLLVVNFIPDARAALAEMVRVTKPGGTVAGAVWDYGEGMEMLRTFWDEAVALQPSAAPRDERHMPFCRPGELAALWRESGLQGRVGRAADDRDSVHVVRRLLAAVPGQAGPCRQLRRVARRGAIATRLRLRLRRRLTRRRSGQAVHDARARLGRPRCRRHIQVTARCDPPSSGSGVGRAAPDGVFDSAIASRPPSGNTARDHLKDRATS